MAQLSDLHVKQKYIYKTLGFQYHENGNYNTGESIGIYAIS